MDADPNWLFATMAGCSATIVAIVGGLMTSFLLQLALDRSTTAARIEECISDSRELNRQKAELTRELERTPCLFLILDRLGEVLALPRTMSASEARTRLGARHLSPSGFDDAWNITMSLVAKWEPTINSADRPVNPPDLHQWLLSQKLDPPSEEMWLVEGMYERKVLGRRDTVTTDVTERGRRIAGIEERRRDTKLKSELVESERKVLVQRLARLNTPSHLKYGLAIIGVFCFVGIALPMLMLPQSAREFTNLRKALMECGFIAALFLMFGYITFLAVNSSRYRPQEDMSPGSDIVEPAE